MRCNACTCKCAANAGLLGAARLFSSLVVPHQKNCTSTDLHRHNPSLITFPLLHYPPPRLQPILAVLSPPAPVRHAGSASTQRSCTGCRPWLHPIPLPPPPQTMAAPGTQAPHCWTHELKLSPLVCASRRESPSKNWANSATANGGRGGPPPASPSAAQTAFFRPVAPPQRL